ncbi:hypothetical protein [Methanotorris formicicus]|uniref:Uncharacterized protein n=1 Tax=Methanotorris formicicus Mc-S-70 TaxID=647171 RepID=H1L1L3_9EURY|nr:hypothetical protein [Methanotorris formicicus]EHP83637.1 hypothetical protein MetfoDRAFT_1937 [Methanotorris formicicus Mc-S-70]
MKLWGKELFKIFALVAMLCIVGGVFATSTINNNVKIIDNKDQNLQNLPIYIFGDKNYNMPYISCKINDLTKIPKGKYIIIIAKTPNKDDSKLLENMLKNGNVIITTKDSYKKIQSIVSKIIGTKKPVVSISYTDKNGKIVENKIYIYMLSPSKIKGKKYCIHVYGFAGDNISDSVIKKATEMLQYSPKSNDWNYVDRVYWSSGDWAKPYGRLNIEHIIMQNPNNPSYKCVRGTTQIISGESLGWEDNGWVYDNYELKNYYKVDYNGNGNHLVDYSPGDIDNTIPSISVTLGYLPSLSISWNYPGDHIYRIVDLSDFSENVACWEHLFHCWYNPWGTSATIKVEPGFEYEHSGSAEQLWKITGKWLAHYYCLRADKPEYLTVYIHYNG